MLMVHCWLGEKGAAGGKTDASDLGPSQRPRDPRNGPSNPAFGFVEAGPPILRRGGRSDVNPARASSPFSITFVSPA